MTTTDTAAPAAALTFRGDPDLKAALVAEAKTHREQDRLLRGVYLELNGTWRGCAVGCTVAARLTERELRDYDTGDTGMDWHHRWAKITGCPQWLAHAEDAIFESLPIDDAQEWPVRFLTAIPVGIDLAPTREAWLRDIVFDPEHGALANAATALEAARLPSEAADLRSVPATADWATAKTAARAIAKTADLAGDAYDAGALAASSAADAAARACDDATFAPADAVGSAAWAAKDALGDGDAFWQWAADRLIHHLEQAGTGVQA